jgi:hypothetical protein
MRATLIIARTSAGKRLAATIAAFTAAFAD